MFLVSSPPSMTTLRFPHFSSMNTTFSKSSKFPMSSISIPIPRTTFYERSVRDFISGLFAFEKNVNEIASWK